MNPWLWLLWGVAVLVVLFFASAAVAAVVSAIRADRECPACGHRRGDTIQRIHLRDLS